MRTAAKHRASARITVMIAVSLFGCYVPEPPPSPPPPPASPPPASAEAPDDGLPDIPAPIAIDGALGGQAVLLWRPSYVQMDETARAKVGSWPDELIDDLERRMVEAGLRVTSDANRPHDWDVRVTAAVDGKDGVYYFSRASLRVEYDGVALDFADMNPSEKEARRGHPDRVATLLLNALGHAPRLLAHVSERRAAAAQSQHDAAPQEAPVTTAPSPSPPPSRGAARAASPMAPRVDACRRACAATEERDAQGCCGPKH
jgi:hypothetical protein